MTRYLFLLCVALAGCGDKQTVIGPDFPLSEQGRKLGVYHGDSLVLNVERKGDGKAEYTWYAPPERAIAEMMKWFRRHEIQDHRNQGTLEGDCILLDGKKYCTGDACRR